MENNHVHTISKINAIMDNSCFSFTLHFDENITNIREYIIHCTAIFNDTSIVSTGYSIEKDSTRNVLQLKINLDVDGNTPSLNSPTYIQNTIHLGRMPKESQHGDIEIYYITPDLKKAFTDKEPKAVVSTSSARERI